MNRLGLLLVAACTLVWLANVRTASAKDDRKSVEIHTYFANIYEYLDPKSTVIKQARRGESYELVYAGTSWYQVRVKDRVGWLERRAGEIVDSPGARILGMPVGVFIVFVVLLLATLFGVALLIYRQMEAET